MFAAELFQQIIICSSGTNEIVTFILYHMDPDFSLINYKKTKNERMGQMFKKNNMGGFMKKVLAFILSIMLVMGLIVSTTAFSSVAVKSIKLDKGSITLKVGQTYDLKVKFTPANTTQKLLKFTTANKKIAMIDGDGTIVAMSKGTTVITV